MAKTKKRTTKKRFRKYRGARTMRQMGIGFIPRYSRSGYSLPKYFKRTATISNSSGLDVSAQLAKGADYLSFTVSGTGGGLVYGAFSLQFSLADLPNYTEFTTLFDSWRLRGVRVKLTPFFSQGLTGAAVSSGLAQTNVLMHTAIDYDSISRPAASDAGIDTIRQYDNYRMMRVGLKPFVRFFKPKMQQTVAGGSAEGKRSLWLDCADPAILHNGLLAVLEANNAGVGQTFYFKCEATYYIQFKGTR